MARKAATITTASLLSNSDLTFGLRINGRTLLDITEGYAPPPAQMLATSTQCYRFINSELHYNRYAFLVLFLFFCFLFVLFLRVFLLIL